MHSVRVTYRLKGFHSLKNARGALEPVHAHEWAVECEFASSRLDDAGCVIDFDELDRRAYAAMAPFEGADMGSHPLMAGQSPSAEVIAQTLHACLAKALHDLNVTVRSVVVWEDDNHAGCFTEDV